MADKEKDDGYVYSEFYGTPVKTPKAASEEVYRSGEPVIGRQEAIEGAEAQRNLSYVDENWGSLGKLGMGGLSGLTLGIGPGILASMGVVDPGHLRAAQASGLYTAGDIAGTIAPALVSGGDSLLARGLGATPAGLMGAAGGAAEGLAAKLLPEAAGVLGSVAGVPIRMAARGATEGAILNLGHQVGENLIQNKPLAAEAMAAMTDGALMGGLIGGGLGTAGALGAAAVEGVGKFARRVATGGGESRAIARVSEELGLSSQGMTKESLREYNRILTEGGSGMGESGASKLKGTQNFIKAQEGVRQSAIETLESQASSFVPSFSRIGGRLDELEARFVRSPDLQLVQKEVNKVREELRNVWPHGELPEVPPQEPVSKSVFEYGENQKPLHQRKDYSKLKSEVAEGPTRPRGIIEPTGEAPDWEGLIKARDQFAARATTPIRKEALTILDSEIQNAMSGAAKTMGTKVAAAAEEYAASTMGLKMARQLEESLGVKLGRTSGVENIVNFSDIGKMAGQASIGYGVSAVGWGAAKGIGRIVQNRSGPWLAQLAYDSSIAAKAADSTVRMKSRIGRSLEKFFSNTSKSAPKAGNTYAAEKRTRKGYDRTQYEAETAKVQRLLTNNHMDRVRRHADEVARQGYVDLANQMMAVNQRAVLYAMQNMPKAKGAKGLTSLRPMPVPKTLDMDEHRFMRILRGFDLTTLMDDFDSGELSRDEVRAAWNIYPEIKNEIASQAMVKIADMKASGESLPMDKVMNLSLLLDTPLDRVAEADFVQPIQDSLAAPPPASPAPGPMPPMPANMSVEQTGLMTPLQQTVLG